MQEFLRQRVSFTWKWCNVKLDYKKILFLEDQIEIHSNKLKEINKKILIGYLVFFNKLFIIDYLYNIR